MKRKESQSSVGGIDKKIMHEEYTLDWSQSKVFTARQHSLRCISYDKFHLSVCPSQSDMSKGLEL